MPSTFWDEVKKTLKGGIEKTEEYTKIGKLKVDIISIKRNRDKSFSELGREVFKSLDKSKQSSLQSNETINKHIAEIRKYNSVIRAKEKEIEDVKKEASKEGPKESPEPKKEAPKKPTPKKPAPAKKTPPKKNPPKKSASKPTDKAK